MGHTLLALLCICGAAAEKERKMTVQIARQAAFVPQDMPCCPDKPWTWHLLSLEGDVSLQNLQCKWLQVFTT